LYPSNDRRVRRDLYLCRSRCCCRGSRSRKIVIILLIAMRIVRRHRNAEFEVIVDFKEAGEEKFECDDVETAAPTAPTPLASATTYSWHSGHQKCRGNTTSARLHLPLAFVFARAPKIQSINQSLLEKQSSAHLGNIRPPPSFSFSRPLRPYPCSRLRSRSRN
jgi:hypothetical protein